MAMRVLHFVTGGFSGATQVAVDLCLAAQQDPNMQVLLVLRRKSNTDPQRVHALRDKGIQVQVVSNWLHALTVWELRKIIRIFKPDAVFAHGFSDHIWGRQAAVAEGVAQIFHVEHNSRERYTSRRLKQALALAPYTKASIGVSEGVRQSLVMRGFPANRCIAIPNGIALERFPKHLSPALWSGREPALIMTARFAKQKDHATLLQALALLKEQGITPRLYLAGSGNKRLFQKVQVLVEKLALEQQVVFLGNVSDLPNRLAMCQVFVLSTHWEGMPLALVEAMASGCACIASNVAGVQGVLEHMHSGLMVPESDAQSMADAIARLLHDPSYAQRLGDNARKLAMKAYGRETMWLRYQELLNSTEKKQSAVNGAEVVDDAPSIGQCSA